MKTLWSVVRVRNILATLLIVLFISYNIYSYYYLPYYRLCTMVIRLYGVPATPEGRAAQMEEFDRGRRCNLCQLALVDRDLGGAPCGHVVRAIMLAIRKARGSLRTILILAVLLVIMWSVPIVLAIRIAVVPPNRIFPPNW